MSAIKKIIRISGLLLAKRELERFVAQQLQISEIGRDMSLQATQSYHKAMTDAHVAIVVELTDALLNGCDLVELVATCYNYRWGLEIVGDFRLVLDYFIQQLMDKRKCNEALAKMTALAAFPNGVFVRNMEQ